MNRRPLIGLALAVAFAAAPAVAYETLEKTAEHLGHHGPWFSHSLAAEIETPWNPSTGVFVVDRFLHEMDETRHFWRLVGRSVPRAGSAPAVATVVPGR